ncbi:MAG: hypothetical protein JW841_06670 [Deltaproteobacteria bacterium]|nr:hypothetical protein [Deltaproteobacteria bacterium]
MQQTAKARRVGDALLAYYATIQSFLRHQITAKESFHYTKDTKGSLTLAINTVLQLRELNSRKLILASEDLESHKLNKLVKKHWSEIIVVYKSQLTGKPLVTTNKKEHYDAHLYKEEVKRLQRIEQDQEHAKLQKIVNSATMAPILADIKAAEPSFIKRNGKEVLKAIDSPVFWEMVGVATVTRGIGSNAILGRATTPIARLFKIARKGELCLETFGLCAATITIDGVALHAGMNGLHWALDEQELIDNSPEGYFWSVVMMGAVQFAGALHARAVASYPSSSTSMSSAARH